MSRTLDTLVDPRLDGDWAQDGMDEAEVPVAAVTPLSGVVSNTDDCAG